MDDTQAGLTIKKPDATGLSYYGDKFEGYMRIGQLTDLIPQFKEYYYDRRIKNMKLGIIDAVQGFNEEVAYPQNKMFHPYTTQLRGWIKKWNADILAKQFGMKEEEGLITMDKKVTQIIKTRNDENGLVAPEDGDLERGTRTLAGELLNDAMQMLRDDQALEDIYDDEILLKRRAYVVNVFSHATKLVHGKAALMLKASEEKRNTASFLMTLLAKATAGKMTDEEMALLKSTYRPAPQNVQPA